MDLLSRIPESAPVKQAWRAFASQDGFSQIKQLFAVEALVDGAMWDVFAHAFFAGAARAAEEAGSVWEPQLDAARAETEAVRALAAELVEDYAIAARIVERAQHIQAPEDAEVEALCKRFGYGAVMDAASRLWVGLDPIGAIVPGACLGIVQRALARARALGIGGEKEKPHD